MPDAEAVVGELKSVVQFAQVGRHAVTHQLHVGDEPLRDVIAADVDGDLRCGVAAVDDAAETADVGLVEGDRAPVGVHLGPTAVQPFRLQLHRAHRHYAYTDARTYGVDAAYCYRWSGVVSLCVCFCFAFSDMLIM